MDELMKPVEGQRPCISPFRWTEDNSQTLYQEMFEKFCDTIEQEYSRKPTDIEARAFVEGVLTTSELYAYQNEEGDWFIVNGAYRSQGSFTKGQLNYHLKTILDSYYTVDDTDK